MQDIFSPPKIAPNDIKPVITTIEPGTEIRRIYKDKDGRTEKTFNFKKSAGRFDHHLESSDNRGTSYWGWGDTLSCCLVEVFGDQRFIDTKDRANRRAAIMIIDEPLFLLDLRKNGSMKVGINAKIAKDGARKLTQEWSRYFYDNPQVFTEVDGLIYSNSHNEETAICFYERAIPKLQTAETISIGLNDPAIQAEIQQCCLDHRMEYL